jgi:vacuolar protein sorting-associated protein 13A/C
MTLSAREHLNLNISTTFIELALTTFSMWTQEKDRVLNQARGSYAPYRIRNRTGSPINVWSDIEGSESKDSAPTKILNNQTVEWRFDDWRTMREVRYIIQIGGTY